ncbi:hypothetical protein BH09PLA1_BH09PLA1_34030 [soil metagenome]
MRRPHPGATHRFSKVSSLVVRRAFSVVELLVVIGLIALLVGLLLPVISRARASAASTACQNNLRSIAQACHSRASATGGYVGLAGVIDNDGLQDAGIPSQLLDSERRRYQYLQYGPTHWDLKALPLVLAEQMSNQAASGDPSEARAITRNADTNVLQVFRCPGRRGEPSGVRATHQIARGVVLVYDYPLDYGFNAGVFGFHHSSSSVDRRARGKLPSLRSESVVLACDIEPAAKGAMAAFTLTVPGSGAVVTLADATARTPELIVDSARPGAPHRGRVNVVFADSHVVAADPNRLVEYRLSP